MASTGIRGRGLTDGAARFGSGSGWLARASAPAFRKVVDRIDLGLASGSIRARLPGGETRVLGARAPGYDAEIEIVSWRSLMRLATSGSIGWYQAWEAGEWTSPDPVMIFAVFGQNARTLGDTGRAKAWWRRALRKAHWLNRNTREGAARNVSAHYDLGNDFYAAWLGDSMTYSSAIFASLSNTSRTERSPGALDAAQLAKATTMIARTGAAQDDRLLEIGCGWGMLAHAAAAGGIRVDAISLSDEQLAHAAATGGDTREGPRFRKQDYRDVEGEYDAIVSVEMVEALGREYWPDFMDCLARNLRPGGRAAIQYISMREDLFEDYAASADFIQAYVFPGGLLIRTAEFRALAEERGLRWTDETRFGLHYAETLRLWRENFDRAVREGALPAGFDRRFVDLWRYYLMYCEGGFLAGSIDVHQVTLVKET